MASKSGRIESLLRDGLLTQKQIAEEVKCSQGYVSLIKSSLSAPPAKYSVIRAELTTIRAEVAQLRAQVNYLANN